MRLACKFIKDGASFYTVRGLLQLLKAFFDTVIFRGSDKDWAPHKPDLKLLVLRFLGTFKDNYCNKPGSKELRLPVG